MIEAEKATYLSVAWMCRLLNVPRSSFYAWRNRVETPTAARRRALAVQVRRVFDNSRQTSGCRRVAAALNRDGHECSVGMVADLMRELGLAAVQPRAYKRTTVPGEHPLDSPDLLGRDFTAGLGGGAPGERLVGDITYLRTGEGWLYLATVIDLATRMVVGWQIATHMRTSLILDALAWPSTPGTSDRTRSSIPTAAPKADSTGRRNTLIRRWRDGRRTEAEAGSLVSGADPVAGPADGRVA